VPDGLVKAMVIGAAVSAVTGWLAVTGLLKLVRTRSFTPFVVYRIVLGVVVLLVGW